MRFLVAQIAEAVTGSPALISGPCKSIEASPPGRPRFRDGVRLLRRSARAGAGAAAPEASPGSTITSPMRAPSSAISLLVCSACRGASRCTAFPRRIILPGCCSRKRSRPRISSPACPTSVARRRCASSRPTIGASCTSSAAAYLSTQLPKACASDRRKAHHLRRQAFARKGSGGTARSIRRHRRRSPEANWSSLATARSGSSSAEGRSARDCRKVTFAGRLGEQETLERIAASDILVLPSFMEGLPIVLMEAMALGTAVIASRVAGIPELVEDGKIGAVVHAVEVGRTRRLHAAPSRR